MLEQTDAFDLLCDKIAAHERFAGELVAEACNGTPKAYLILEEWIFRKKYQRRIENGKVFYYYNPTPIGKI